MTTYPCDNLPHPPLNGRYAVFMQNEALHIVIMLNKSQDCELKLFPIFFNVIFY